MHPPYLLQFEVRHNDGKGIPYPGRHPDGEYQNHGYFSLVERQDLIDKVPEAMNNPELRMLLQALNDPAGGLMTTGCAKWHKPQQDGSHVISGYVEFCFNSHSMGTDASDFFPLFFHFGVALEKQRFSTPVQFQWELMAAHFVEKNLDTYTVAVFMHTRGTRTKAETQWVEAVTALREFLYGAYPVFGDPLFAA